jgi:hypothetical protein
MSKIDDLKGKLMKLEGPQNIPFKELFTLDFMRKHTRFTNIDEMLKAGGFETENQADFEKTSEDEIDQFVKQQTTFKTWKEMRKSAAEQWFKKKLEL